VTAEFNQLADVDAANAHRRFRVMVAGALAVSTFQGLGTAAVARSDALRAASRRPAGPVGGAAAPTMTPPPAEVQTRRLSRVVVDLRGRLARMDRTVEQVKVLDDTQTLAAGFLPTVSNMHRWTLEFVDAELEKG
jgi:hypothetical protein